MPEQKLHDAFAAGMAASHDDESRQPLKPGKVVETSSLSPWLYLKCSACKHSFRAGDTVEMGKRGVQHSNPPQGCPGSSASREEPAERAGFFEGLQEGWPSPASQRVVRLTLRSPQLAAPLGGLPRRSCPVCAHTFRAGDEVVICPCSPSDAQCDTAIHRDPIHKLSCWELWNPGKRLASCPITLRKMT